MGKLTVFCIVMSEAALRATLMVMNQKVPGFCHKVSLDRKEKAAPKREEGAGEPVQICFYCCRLVQEVLQVFETIQPTPAKPVYQRQ